MRGLILAGLLLAPAIARAEAPACVVPAVLPDYRIEGPRDQPRRRVPTTHYKLALSWSPGFCAGRALKPADRFQCDDGGRRAGLSLHGLWPEGKGDQWPQYCRAATLLPERVIRAGLCATPSAQLLQHEWEKHGTCMAPSPDAYFRTSIRLYRALRLPDMAALTRREGLTAGALAAAFAARNPGMTAESIAVRVKRDGTLDELWLCLNRRLRYTRCPAGSGGVPRATSLAITLPA